MELNLASSTTWSGALKMNIRSQGQREISDNTPDRTGQVSVKSAYICT